MIALHKFLFAGLCLILAAGRLAADAPNIIYVLADDLGYGDVAALNPEKGKIRTPHLDRLAAEGMTFTDAHSGSSVCTPTRYGVLTGRYSWRGTLASGVLGGMSPPLVAEGRPTVASMLKQRGYRTACIGKWHLGLGWEKRSDDTPRGWPVDLSKPFKRGPVSMGFDTYHGISASLDMPPYTFLSQVRVTALPTTTKKWVREGPAAPEFEAVDVLPVLTRKTVETIEAAKTDKKPFFIYLALASPHTPIVPSPEWQGKSGLGAYGDFVMQTDACVGEIVAALDRSGLNENTLVIFTSDNGCSPEADFDALAKSGHHPGADLRGMKSDIFEGGHRVPFIVKWPAKTKAGSSSATPVCLTDLMATAAEITGADVPEGSAEDSFSILPDLAGTGKSARANIVHHSIHGQFAVREGDWKLAFCPGSGGWSKPGDVEARKNGRPAVQLYNLADDIGETTNLQQERPEIVARLTALMEKLVADGRSTPGPPCKNDTTVDFRKPRP